MSRLETIIQRLSKIEVNAEQNTVGGEIKTLLQQSYENLDEIEKCSCELRKNTKIVEDLRAEESELTRVVKKNREEICKLMYSIKQLENTLSIQKSQLNARKKDHEYNVNELRKCASIETALAEAMMEQLGLRVKLSPIDGTNWSIEFIFGDNKSVSVVYNAMDHSFDLQAIEPPHPNLDKARSFLRDSNDITGCLCAIREFHFKDDDLRMAQTKETTESWVEY